MKKIFVIFLSIITISSAMFLGGCSMLNSRSEKEEMIRIAEGKKAQRAIEELLRQEDPKALTEEGIIKEYSINKNELDYNPMGGLIVELIINDDSELTITTTLVEESDGKLEHTGYVISGELAKKLRGE
ncbi:MULTISPECIES: DUF1310 family protein [Streptococcus]|uniref:Lmo2807 protein n=1 Tax=Streptococcus sanguinis TaxID=1305 RepID=A0A2X3XEM6_STRSA|nr:MULTISPECIES: DUF1310 family protein [Streptococcus]EGF07926.1 hypothetical protein HMPREF9378_1027 [Streptococcus sanguinis SK1 = NCTC 7863]EGF21247.1 hypothetical protein HMPREF9395_1620 [Streptococcus sanguinis SK1058]EGJ43743.1 hypothetical protein HMPREF9396_1128 [Streptococcus sanguinis SK1059]EGQ20221.1 hypothetical protein HMPREF8573_1118 [Streptococcus sanguinis ATCC 29667]EGQ23466.1 hypothetical protein HMPREF9387_1671 [Streptococcus sanguinis SK340]